MTNEPASRSFWTWWVCGLLLCASTINYMDRQTLSTVSPRIKHEFDLSNEKYGNLEFGFGVAFAAGACAHVALPWIQSLLGADGAEAMPTLAVLIGVACGASVWWERIGRLYGR